MPTYAIGDVQGCRDDLLKLLDQLHFDPAADRLWFVGDLVNRGPDNIGVLRLIHGLGEQAKVVLGNHDLHLLAIAFGDHSIKRKDTLQDIFAADDHEELLHWLRHQKLFHWDAELNFAMVHAGLPPQWNILKADKRAREVEAALQGDDYRAYFKAMYGDHPANWHPGLKGMDRLRFITNCFTRLRYCNAEGRPALQQKGSPGTQPKGLYPWFAVPGRKKCSGRIVFGHWSTLGLHQHKGVYSIDSGCLWGGSLTALRLDGKPKHISLDCAGYRQPG